MSNLQVFTNNASTLLAGSNLTDVDPNAKYAIVSGQGTPFYIYVAPGTGNLFPSSAELVDGNFFVITIEDVVARTFEIFRVSARDGDKLTISLRTQEGTVRNNFPTGAKVELRWTRDSIERLRQYARDLATGYVHEQLTPSTLWVLNHDLGKLPEVEVWVKVGSLYEAAEAEIRYVDDNTIGVYFSEATTGKAIVR